MANFEAMVFLKERLADAQKAFEEEKVRYAQATAAWQSANNLVNACVRLIDEENRRQKNAPTPGPAVSFTAEIEFSDNKTKLIRDALMQRAGGVTPKELWELVRAQIKHRPYVYSVLKRLSDRKEVVKRRGKYFFVQPPEDKTVGPNGGETTP